MLPLAVHYAETILTLACTHNQAIATLFANLKTIAELVVAQLMELIFA